MYTFSRERRAAPHSPVPLSPDAAATWYSAWLPRWETVWWVVPSSALFVWSAARWVGRLRMDRGVRTAYTRKIFHFLVFTAAGALHLFSGRPAVVAFGSVVAVAVGVALWRGDGSPFYEALARPSDRPRRRLFIVVPLVTTAAGGVTANLFFAPWAWVGYLVSGWGDAIAEPVGARWGEHTYRVPSLAGVEAERSLEGSASVFLASTVAAGLGLSSSGVAVTAAAGVALACAAGATVVEAVSNHGVDNFTVQVAAAAVADALL